MSEIIHPLVRLADPTPEGWHESPSYESEERNDKRFQKEVIIPGKNAGDEARHTATITYQDQDIKTAILQYDFIQREKTQRKGMRVLLTVMENPYVVEYPADIQQFSNIVTPTGIDYRRMQHVFTHDGNLAIPVQELGHKIQSEQARHNILLQAIDLRPNRTLDINKTTIALFENISQPTPQEPRRCLRYKTVGK